MNMKLPLSLVALLLLITQTAFADLTRLSDNVYSYVGEKDASPSHSFAANAGIVIGRDGVLVVDTLISAKEGERFLADIRKITKKSIKYVVNTHTHLDHAFGNCVFAELGATVISHSADKTLLAKSGAEILTHAEAYGLKPEDLIGTAIVLPVMTFSERMRIDLGGVEVELIRTAPSHTEGSLVLWLPQQKILFSGDILFTDFHPFMADGDLSGWLKTLDYLQTLGADRIIPGHGPLSSSKDLKEMREYLIAFDATAREMAAKGATADAITAELLKQLPKRALAEWMVGHNVKARYIKPSKD